MAKYGCFPRFSDLETSSASLFKYLVRITYMLKLFLRRPALKSYQMQIIEEKLQFYLIAQLQELAQLGDVVNKEVMGYKN